MMHISYVETIDPGEEKDTSKEDEVVAVEKRKSDKKQQKKVTKECDPLQKTYS